MSEASPRVLERPRVALVGWGSIAPRHASALRALSGQFEWVGGVEPDPEARSRAPVDGTQRWVGDLETGLSELDPSLVVLASPSGLHPEQTVLAAQRGVHVLTEKPMALDLASAEAMQQTCEQSGVHLFVVQQLREAPTIRALRAALDDELLGTPRLIDVRILWSRPQSYYEQAPWRQTRALSGGVLLNQANHYLDLLVYLFGMPESVTADGATLARSIETEDTVSVVMRWPERMATLTVTMLAHPRNLETSLTILGDEGVVRLDGPNCSRVARWELRDASPFASPPDSGGDHLAVYRRVHSVLTGQSEPPSLCVCLETLRVIEAIGRSVSEGRRISLSEVS